MPNLTEPIVTIQVAIAQAQKGELTRSEFDEILADIQTQYTIAQEAGELYQKEELVRLLTLITQAAGVLSSL